MNISVRKFLDYSYNHGNITIIIVIPLYMYLFNCKNSIKSPFSQLKRQKKQKFFRNRFQQDWKTPFSHLILTTRMPTLEVCLSKY